MYLKACWYLKSIFKHIKHEVLSKQKIEASPTTESQTAPLYGISSLSQALHKTSSHFILSASCNMSISIPILLKEKLNFRDPKNLSWGMQPVSSKAPSWTSNPRLTFLVLTTLHPTVECVCLQRSPFSLLHLLFGHSQCGLWPWQLHSTPCVLHPEGASGGLPWL